MIIVTSTKFRTPHRARHTKRKCNKSKVYSFQGGRTWGRTQSRRGSHTSSSRRIPTLHTHERPVHSRHTRRDSCTTKSLHDGRPDPHRMLSLLGTRNLIAAIPACFGSCRELWPWIPGSFSSDPSGLPGSFSSDPGSLPSPFGSPPSVSDC